MGLSFEDLTEATSGAVGGLLSTSILYPLDTCKTKYQAESRAGKTRKYRSSLDVLREANSSQQLLALYQGIGTKLIQSFISQFIYFYSYSYVKQFYLRKSRKKRMGTGANLIVAAAAGACTVVITQPLDTASAQMQTSSFGKSKSLWRTFADGDLKQAFRGIGASLVLTSNPAIQYTVYEQLKGRLIKSQNARVGMVDSPCNTDAVPVVLSALSAFFLGALSKTVATVVTYPAIRCKVLLQAAELEDKLNVVRSSERLLKSMADAIRFIWYREGPMGFYKGLQAQILKTLLGAALMLMIKEKTSQGTWLLMMAFKRWLNASPRITKTT